MNYQNGLYVTNREEVQRGQFEKTSKCFTRRGMVLIWAAMLLMAVAILAPTPLTLMVSSISFSITFLLYIVAERKGTIFEYIVFQQNHAGRQIISMLTFVILFVGLVHLAIYNNPVIFLFVGLAVATSATALRFLGEKK